MKSSAAWVRVWIKGSCRSSTDCTTRGRISQPPSAVPRMIEPTVVPSIQPFAITSFSGGNSSVRMPYLAGEYDCIRHQHHAAFGHCIGEGADKSRQRNIEENKKQLEQRRHPGRRSDVMQQGNRGN